MNALRDRTAALTCSVRVAVVVQTSSGYRLATKEGITVKVVAELLQEAEDVGDAADRRQGQGVLLLVEEGWTRKQARFETDDLRNVTRHATRSSALPDMTSPPCPDFRQEKTVA